MATIKVLHLVAGFTLLYSVQCQSTVRFIALTESQQVSIPQIFSEGVKKAEEANDFKLDETTIDISREGEEEGYQKLCQEVKNGVSAILDFTWTGWYKSKKLAEDAGIPYLRIDATISPFVQAVDDYLRKRNGTDAALIFQNEAELDQSLYYLIGNSILRVIVLNRLQDNTTAGLKKMRPTPSYFVIFASTENMRTIFSTALSGQLVSRDSRWNLVFTDFSYDQFDKKMLDVTVSLIHMKKSVCCRLLKQNMDCSCPQDMEIIPQFIRNVLQYLGDIVKTVTAEAMAPKEVDCSAPTKDPSVSQQFYDAIQPLSQNHESVGYDNKEKMMYYRSDMELYSANKENNTHIGTWTKEAGFQLAVDYEMVPIKKFFRVGTIEVGHALKYIRPSPYFLDMSNLRYRSKNDSQSYVFRVMNDHYWEPFNATNSTTE